MILNKRGGKEFLVLVFLVLLTSITLVFADELVSNQIYNSEIKLDNMSVLDNISINQTSNLDNVNKNLILNSNNIKNKIKFKNKHDKIINTNLKIINIKEKISKEVNKEKTNNSLIKSKDSNSNSIKLKSSVVYDIEITPDSSPVKNIQMKDVSLDNKDYFELKVDNFDPDQHDLDFVNSYAIDPSDVDFSTANVTVVARGTTLYKCENWDFDNELCDGEWILYKTGLVPGEEYTFTITPDDPGFGEIIAVDAVHLDENYNTIENIFESIVSIDDIFSNKIYENEIVRVTYEEPLDNGNVIDFVATSNNTLCKVNIFDVNSGNLVGSSNIIDGIQTEYVEVSNLDNPSNSFDFVINKIIIDDNIVDSCKEICLEDSLDHNDFLDCIDDCNDPTTDDNREAYVIFDYIHDEAINITFSDGLLVYESKDSAIPHYRTWNESLDFSAESDALSVGIDEITWVVLKANHERDEMILGTIDKNNDLNLQIFNSSYQWSDLLEISTGIENSGYRGFDIAYEGISGDALIVYENSNSGSDSDFAYRIWNGSEYSVEYTFTTSLTTDEFNWIFLYPKQKSDIIMVLAHNGVGDLYAIPWNGSSFDENKAIAASNGTTSSSEQHFTFGWGYGNIENGVLIYGENNNIGGRTFDYDNVFSNYWSSEGTIVNLGASLDGIRSCSDPNSDYIGFIWQNTKNDVQVRMWDGSQFLGSFPAEEITTESSGFNSINVDCAWINSSTALFSFVDNRALSLDYLTFTKSNTWSAADLSSTFNSGDFASDDIKSIRFNKNPVNDEVMVVVQDNAEDTRVIRYNGTFITPTNYIATGLSEVINGNQESVMFDWYRFDPSPNVSSVYPDGLNFDLNTIIQINASVTDNININYVMANITLPNGSVFTLELSDENSDNIYNNSFSTTNVFGIYTFNIFANDTSFYNNIDASGTGSFSISESINPSVNISSPIAGSIFNISSDINISVNSSDNDAVHSVICSILYPNSSSFNFSLVQFGLSYFYNRTIIAPNVVGTYNISIFSNDTSGNLNNTENTYFIVDDVVNPNVTLIKPISGTNFSIGERISVEVNVSDDSNVSNVLVNITLTNSSVVQYNLTRFSNVWNLSYEIPSSAGIYNLTFIVNDSANNINSSIISYFRAIDPSSTVINNLGCNPEIGSVGQNITCNISATDGNGIFSVGVNIALPNTSIVSVDVNNISNNFHFNFSTTNIVGHYNITWWVNNSLGVIELDYFSFTINDSIPPVMSIYSPVNNSNLSAPIVINYSFSDNYYNTSSCSLYIDNILNSTADVINNTPSTFTIISGDETNHSWFVKCVDGSDSENQSGLRYFVLDYTNPDFDSLIYSPSTNDSLDPNVNITIASEIVDNTSIDTAIFQYKLENESVYSNITMTFCNCGNFFNTSFNASQNGTYNLRLWANDTSGNSAYSLVVNISVFYDRTWTRSPSIFTPVTANASVNVSFGNLTINNTGDYDLNFSIVSDSNLTIFSESNFTLSPLGVKQIVINDTAPSSGIKIVNFNISALPDAKPILKSSTARIVVADAQPILSGTFSLPESDAISVTRGSGTLNVETSVINVGGSSAYNVTANLSVPSDWVLTFGSLETSFDEIENNSSEELSYEFSIPSDANLGSFVIFFNVSGVNGTGAELKTENLAFDDSKIVNIISSVPLTANDVVSDGSGTTTVTVTQNPSSGGGGGGGSGITPETNNDLLIDIIDSIITGEEFISSSEQIDIVRGESSSFPIKISNLFPTTIMENVHIEILGYLSQYLKVEQDSLKRIGYGQSKVVDVIITSPEYMELGNQNLKVVISGDITGVNIDKTFVERRDVLLRIHSIDKNTATIYVSKIDSLIKNLNDDGFKTNKIEDMYRQSKYALEDDDYTKVDRLHDSILVMYDDAYIARDLIEKIKKQSKDYMSFFKNNLEGYLNIPGFMLGLLPDRYDESLDLLSLAEIAFEREDYKTAIQRAREAELSLALEESEFKFTFFILDYWWIIILGVIFVAISFSLGHHQYMLFTINDRIKRLQEEENNIHNLIIDTQVKHYKDKKLSTKEFDRTIKQHQKRLNKIQSTKIALRRKRASLIHPDKLMDLLEKERWEIVEVLKKAQILYYRKGKISKLQYDEKRKSLEERLTEVENEIWSLEL